jgi:PAS domain S-box-containing protein
MKITARHSLAYGVSWLFILAFFAWTVDLLLNIQNDWAQSNEVTRIDQDVHGLFNPWRNLNRPGNDVLENYAVDLQMSALDRYLGEYVLARAQLDLHGGAAVSVEEFNAGMDEAAAAAETLARRVLELAAERESLRLAGAAPDAIRAVETEAATTMARMDQAFQAGMGLIVSMDERLDLRLLELAASRRASIGSLYVIVLVALLSSAASLLLLRRTASQGEALRSGSERINAIVNNIVDGIVTVDDAGNIDSFNRTAEWIFGHDAKAIIGRPFTDLLHPEGHARYEADPFQQNEAGNGGAEYRGLRANGSDFYMELAATRIKINGRRLFVHIIRDITERKQADKRLQLAASVFENTTEGILITDRAGRILSSNPAFTAMTGFTPDEVIGQNPRILQSGMQLPEFYQKMWGSIIGTGHWQGEIMNRRKNGEVYPQWLNINAIKDRHGNVTHYVGVAFDISELKSSERMKDEFIATVSHELRTPLTSIHGSLSLLGGGVAGELPEESAELVRIAQENSERLVRLIDDILSIAKIESERMKFQLQPVVIDELIDHALEANRDFANQYGVRLEAESEAKSHAGPARILADNDRLMQVMTNLLSNAVKHSPKGGVVTVSTESLDDFWRISIVDNGPGIPESFRDNVFGKFAQADGSDRRKGGGTGLGLSICQAIITRLGGRIGFESEENVRTRFYFDLPTMERGAGSNLLRPETDLPVEPEPGTKH